MSEPFAARRAYAARYVLATRRPNPALTLMRLLLCRLLRGAERARSRRDLASMDARLLRDIGLSPADRHEEVQKWWWQR